MWLLLWSFGCLAQWTIVSVIVNLMALSPAYLCVRLDVSMCLQVWQSVADGP